jgi:hypothetical protein
MADAGRTDDGNTDANQLDSSPPEPKAFLFAVFLGYATAPDSGVLDTLATVAEHFSHATGYKVGLKIRGSEQLEVPSHDVTEILKEYSSLSEPDAQRLWYYYQPLSVLLSDIESAANGGYDSDIIVLTDVNISSGMGLYKEHGLFARPTSFIETWVIGNWSSTNYTSHKAKNAAVLDVTTHELGHRMGLDHACKACVIDGILDENCCSLCTWKNDVMSYCRDREQNNVFEACNSQNIEENFLPAYEMGQEIPKSNSCE